MPKIFVTQDVYAQLFGDVENTCILKRGDCLECLGIGILGKTAQTTKSEVDIYSGPMSPSFALASIPGVQGLEESILVPEDAYTGPFNEEEFSKLWILNNPLDLFSQEDSFALLKPATQEQFFVLLSEFLEQTNIDIGTIRTEGRERFCFPVFKKHLACVSIKIRLIAICPCPNLYGWGFFCRKKRPKSGE